MKTNSHCPTCRTEISSETPCQRVIGADVEENTECPDMLLALRRTRILLAVEGYENDVLAIMVWDHRNPRVLTRAGTIDESQRK